MRLPSTDTEVLRMEGIGRCFGSAPPTYALEDVNLVVRSGEWLSVQGPSGSGKSTLLSLVGLIDRPTSGRYTLGNVEASQLSDRARSHLRSMEIGFVFQAFHLLPHLTALENVVLPMAYQAGRGRRDQVERASELLEAVGLTHRSSSLPSTLSGGERQRVAMARALTGDPSLLLCDEPTGNLDSATAEEIVELLRHVNRTGVTLMVVTHSPQLADAGSRIVRIVDGRLTEA
jgi:putative ABC transport system ATP-binding protein